MDPENSALRMIRPQPLRLICDALQILHLSNRVLFSCKKRHPDTHGHDVDRSVRIRKAFHHTGKQLSLKTVQHRPDVLKHPLIQIAFHGQTVQNEHIRPFPCQHLGIQPPDRIFRRHAAVTGEPHLIPDIQIRMLSFIFGYGLTHAPVLCQAVDPDLLIRHGRNRLIKGVAHQSHRRVEHCQKFLIRHRLHPVEIRRRISEGTECAVDHLLHHTAAQHMPVHAVPAGQIDHIFFGAAQHNHRIASARPGNRSVRKRLTDPGIHGLLLRQQHSFLKIIPVQPVMAHCHQNVPGKIHASYRPLRHEQFLQALLFHIRLIDFSLHVCRKQPSVFLKYKRLDAASLFLGKSKIHDLHRSVRHPEDTVISFPVLWHFFFVCRTHLLWHLSGTAGGHASVRPHDRRQTVYAFQHGKPVRLLLLPRLPSILRPVKSFAEADHCKTPVVQPADPAVPVDLLRHFIKSLHISAHASPVGRIRAMCRMLSRVSRLSAAGGQQQHHRTEKSPCS